LQVTESELVEAFVGDLQCVDDDAVNAALRQSSSSSLSTSEADQANSQHVDGTAVMSAAVADERLDEDCAEEQSVVGHRRTCVSDL